MTYKEPGSFKDFFLSEASLRSTFFTFSAVVRLGRDHVFQVSYFLLRLNDFTIEKHKF